jgi:hypothetical protein
MLAEAQKKAQNSAMISKWILESSSVPPEIINSLVDQASDLS